MFRFLVLIIALLIPCVAKAQPIFVMDCGVSGVNFPECNWENLRANPQGITSTFVANAFSDNSDGVRWNIDNSQVQFQPSYGWYNDAITPTAAGGSKYIRTKYKRTAGSTGSGASKFLMLEDFPNDFARLNCEIAWGVTGGTQDRFRCAVNIDGPPNRTPDLFLNIGTEYWIQIHARKSTTDTANDGVMSIWLNSCVEGSPTSTATGVDLELASGWPGGLENACCYTVGAGTIEYTIGSTELDNVFDNTWCPGAPPTNKTYYVSTTGNNSNTCAQAESTATPKQTIAAGIACLSASDILYIRGGTYTEQILESSFVNSGTSWGNHITVSGYPGEEVILRPSSTQNVLGFPTGNRSYIEFKDLILDGINAGGGSNGSALYTEVPVHHLRFRRIEVKNADGNGLLILGNNHEFFNIKVHNNGLFTGYLISIGAYITGDNNLISGGEFYNNECFGVRFWDSAHPTTTADNNVVQNAKIYNNGFGIGLGGTSACTATGGGITIADNNNIARNNLIYNNYVGVQIYTQANGTIIANNTIYNSTVEGIWAQFYTTFPTLRNNIIRLATPIFTDYSGSNTLHSSNLTIDPLFADTTNLDFKLRHTSPARNAGVVVAEVTNDIDGNNRPLEGTYDIGAYEFALVLPLPATRLPLYNWEHAGVTLNGGIPNRTTDCGTILASTYGNGATDAASGITSAIAACDPGEVLLLSAGTFRVDSAVTINKSITIRGAGALSTIINKSNGATRDFSTGYIAPDYSPIFVIGPNEFPAFNRSTAITLAEDAIQGQYSVRVASATGLSVNQYVEVAEDQFYLGSQYLIKPQDGGISNKWRVWTNDRITWAKHEKLPGVINITNSNTSTEVFTTNVTNNYVVNDRVYISGHNGTLVPNATNGVYDIASIVSPTEFTLKALDSTPINVTVSGNTGTVYASKRDQDDFLPGPVDPNGAPLIWESSGGGYVYGEIKKIASITNNIITFTTPFIDTYRVSHKAQIAVSDSAFVESAGIESLTLNKGSESAIKMVNSASSWVKDVKISEYLGPGIQMSNSFRPEITGNWITFAAWPKPGGGGYAMSMNFSTSEALITNNITEDANKNIVGEAGGSGSVISYNYFDDSYIWDIPQSNTPWTEVGANLSHFSGPHHSLFEGNYSHNFDSDFTHGSSYSMVTLRNNFSGIRRSFTGVQNARTIGSGFGTKNFSHVGNVLGLPGQMSGWTYDADGTNGFTGDRHIWKLGYDPVQFTQHVDPQVLYSTVQEGNWNYLTNTIQWNSTASTIPNSYYLTSAPSFFQTCTWPWVDANGTTKLYVNPAKARFDLGTPMSTADVCAVGGGGGIPGANGYGGLTRIKIR